MRKKSLISFWGLILLLFSVYVFFPPRVFAQVNITNSDGSISAADQAKLMAQVQILVAEVERLLSLRANPLNKTAFPINSPNLGSLSPLSDFRDLKDLSRYLRGQNLPDYANFIDQAERAGITINDLKGEFSSLNDMLGNINPNKLTDYSSFLSNFKQLGGDLPALLRNFGNLRQMLSSLNGLNNLRDINRLLSSVTSLGGNLNQLLDGAVDLRAVLRGLDTLRNITQMADTLSRLKDLGGNLNQILSGVGNLNSLFNNLSQLSNLGQINSLLAGLGRLNGTISDLLRGYTSVNNLLSGLNNLSDLRGMVSVMTSLGDLGATAQDLTRAFGDLRGALSQLNGLNLDNVTSNLQDAVSNGLNVSKLTSLVGGGTLSSTLKSLSLKSGVLASTLGGSNLPFGGFTTRVVPCTCSGDYSLITVDPAASNLPTTLMYSPSKATTYEYGQIPRVGVYLLGTHAEDRVCQVYMGVGCSTVGVGKDIVMVGTSGGRAGGGGGTGGNPPPSEPQETFPMPPTAPPDQCKRMGDPAYVYNARGTGYYPTPSATGSDENRMEGGPLDRLERPLQTLQDFLEGRASYVSVAMDSGAFPYGTELCIPEFEAKYGRQIVFRVVDTGGRFVGRGTSRIDVCTRNRQYSEEAPPNGSLTLVSRVQSSR